MRQHVRYPGGISRALGLPQTVVIDISVLLREYETKYQNKDSAMEQPPQILRPGLTPVTLKLINNNFRCREPPRAFQGGICLK